MNKPLQMPMFSPETEWVPPLNLPDLKEYPEIAIDLETRDPGLMTMGSGAISGNGEVVGIAVAVEGWSGYFPIAHEGGGNMDRALVLDWFEEVLHTEATKIFHNAMYDVSWIRAMGFQINGGIIDTMIAASLVNENLLQRVLPKMGVFTAEMLRALAPAYFTSFLPLAIMNEGKAIFEENIAKVLQPVGEISKDDMPEFAAVMWGEIVENHTLRLDGELNLGDPQVEEGMYQSYRGLSNEINHVLDSIDLKLSFKHGSAYLVIHPRVERYLSVLRDVPSDTSDRFLPSRSAPASLARYIYSNSDDDPLDKNPDMRKRTGIASPTFAMGLDILNQMRISTLLPDEMRLSFVPLLRILLMSSQDAETVLNNLERQLETSGISKEEVRPHFERILNQNHYGPLDGYSDPTSYCKQTQTTIHRLHDLRELLEYLQAHLPKRWTKNDVAGMTFIQDKVLYTDEENALIYNSKEAATELLSGKERNQKTLRLHTLVRTACEPTL